MKSLQEYMVEFRKQLEKGNNSESISRPNGLYDEFEESLLKQVS